MALHAESTAFNDHVDQLTNRAKTAKKNQKLTRMNLETK